MEAECALSETVKRSFFRTGLRHVSVVASSPVAGGFGTRILLNRNPLKLQGEVLEDERNASMNSP